jgi:type II secretory pathway component PulF
MSNADLADFADKEMGVTRPRIAELIAPALAWGLALAILVFAVPKFEAIFKDFGVDLPQMTKVILSVAHLWPVPVVTVVLILLVDYKVMEELAKLKDGRGYLRVWKTLRIIPPLIALGSLIVGLGLPLINLMTRLSG